MKLHPLIAECFTTAGLSIPSGTGPILRTANEAYFAKTGPPPQIKAEKCSLQAMSETAPSIIPKVIGHVEKDELGALVTAYHDSGSRSEASQRALGRALAEMHSGDKGRFGFDCPTFCGVTEQDNTWSESWLEFYRDRRLGDLVKRLGDRKVSEVWEAMCDKAVPLLLDIDVPAVPLHGDLWAGNVAWGDKGAVIFDPASYYGHGEADLGIARMFGGFSEGFYEAYFEVHEKSQPYYEERVKLYELYHHLNHALMFGGGYRSSALRIMEGLARWAQEK